MVTEPDMASHQQRTAELIQPILDVFSGADGGVAFSYLRHHLIPSVLASDRKELEQEFITMISQFSRLCQHALTERPR